MIPIVGMDWRNVCIYIGIRMSPCRPSVHSAVLVAGGAASDARRVLINKIPRVADTVVIGSGISGLNAAITIARGGRSVVVLDAKALQSGASTRNAGSMSCAFERRSTTLAK